DVRGGDVAVLRREVELAAELGAVDVDRQRARSSLVERVAQVEGVGGGGQGGRHVLAGRRELGRLAGDRLGGELSLGVVRPDYRAVGGRVDGLVFGHPVN